MTPDRILQALILLSQGLVVAYAGKLHVVALLVLALVGVAASIWSKRVVVANARSSRWDDLFQVLAVLGQALPAAAASVHDVCAAASLACASYSLPPWALIASAAAGGLFGVSSHGLAAKPGESKP